ncbi:hypothetical protein Scep_004481 [Stephania cephalantha]|uniref:Uncharacterized protein n=1 Tax=Stephania cephalantha TaxID=152367 RepID=A0AAP0KUB3_9MAGN
MVLVPRHHITTHDRSHALLAQHGTIPSSSHHSTPSPPGYVYPHEHGIRPSSSHHATPSPSAHPAHSPGVGDEHTSTPTPHRTSSARLHPSSVAAGKMSLVFKSEYLKEMWKWEYVPQSQRDIYWLRWKVFFTGDLQMSFAIYDAWCRKATIRYTGNIYLIAKKRIAPIYLTDEVFEHYKRMRATDEAFKKKSEQMSTNRKSEMEGPGTGISLHSARSISARQHGDTLDKKLKRRLTRKEMFRHLHTHGHDGQTFVDRRDAELTRRLEEMSTQTPDTSIDEDVVYLEVVPEVKGPYGPHELEELQRDHQRLQETLLKERMERQEQMQRDKMERQEENREMQDRLACMEALLMQHLGIRPHVPPTPRTPLSPVTERFGRQSDDQPGHLTTDIAPSQSTHLDYHQPGHWTDPHRRMPEDRHHLLDDHDEFMYVQRWHFILVLLIEKELTRLLCFEAKFAGEELLEKEEDQQNFVLVKVIREGEDQRLALSHQRRASAIFRGLNNGLGLAVPDLVGRAITVGIRA